MNGNYNAYPPNYSSFAPNTSRANYKSEPQIANIAMDAGGLGVLSWIINEGSKLLSQKLMKCEEFTSAEKIHQIADKMIADNGLKGSINAQYVDNMNKHVFKANMPELADAIETVAHGKNAFYYEGRNVALAPKSAPSLMLHELGHAINAAKGGVIKFLQKSRGVAVAVPTALALANGIFKRNEETGKTFLERNAFSIGFLAFLPTIIEEALASYRGINAAKEFLGKSVSTTPLKKAYLLALGTYVLSGIGLGIAAKESLPR